MDIASNNLLIRVMKTPNPLAVKLVVNFVLKQTGSCTFTKKQELSQIPLLLKLFEIPGVHQLFVFENQITLSHKNTLSFDDIKQQSTDIIKTQASNHDPCFTTPQEAKIKKQQASLSGLALKADAILDRTIRPGLQADGGDLQIISFKGDIVKISYQGACGSCPSATTGTLDAIENILRYELQNENIQVQPV